MSLSGRIGAFASGLRWSEIPIEVADRARDRVLDALSTAVAGRVADPYRPVQALLQDEPEGPATVLASGATAGARAAAFANGVATHALLYEDLNLACADHPGAAIVPAALAAAEAGRGSLGDLLAGVLAGYEVQLYLGALAGRGVIARGFRTTSVFGAVAAAVAAARVRKLPAERIAAAAAIGGNFAGGLTESFTHGGDEPYFQAGMAAQQGVTAAGLAGGGARTAPSLFEGGNGYLRAFADAAADDALPITGKWRVMEIICKPYPCSGGKIGAIDSARELRERGLDPASIESVEAFLPALYYAYPGASRLAPFESMSQAQASGQFCVAAALLGYDMEAVETFTRDYRAPDIAALSRRITLAPQSGTQLAKLCVKLKNGLVLAAEADRRDRQIPSIDKMGEKLRTLAKDAWTPRRATDVIGMMTGPIDRPVAALSALLRG
jgi:2-methylcitrate dehydratase PrpD